MEFLAVVMAAGPGSEMSELTSQCPKALLTVGNYPMVYYPVSMLHRQGFSAAYVVVPRTYEGEIRTALTDLCKSNGVMMRLTFVTIPDLDEWGTAVTLRCLRNNYRIPESADLLVVGCDLITDLDLTQVLNVFRLNDASVVTLLSAVDENSEVSLPGSKGKGEKEKDLIGICEKTNRLLLMKTMGDANKEEVFDPELQKKYPRIRLRTTMTDCHLYVLKRWILDYLTFHKDCEKMSSLKHDLLPHILKKQFPSESRLRKSRALWQKKPSDDDDQLEGPRRLLPVNKENDMYGFAEIYKACKINASTANLSLFLSGNYHHHGDMSRDPDGWLQNNDVIRCFAYVTNSGFCVRSNTLRGYCEANRQVSKAFPVLMPHHKELVHPSVKPKKSSQKPFQVGPDCIVGEGSDLGEKVSVKKSVVGKKCVVQDKAKVVNSIIMDEVEIGESSIIMNSILCTGASVAGMCELKDCIVAPSMSVPPLSKSNNEVISDAERAGE